MRRIVIALIAVLGLALLGLSAPASAHEHHHGHTFKATFTGATTNITYAPGFDLAKNPTATSTFDGRCPGGASWVISQAGVGSGTSVRDFAWTSTHCTLLTSLNPPNAKILAGQFAYLTGNGDILHETYVGKGGLVQQGDKLCGDTVATFAGGTGMFEGAHGRALEHGCWPASIQGPVITGLVVNSSGKLYLDSHHHD